MNAIIQQQLDRVEAALNALTDSITSYNPSLQAAHELLAADSALAAGVNQLSTHQSNHARLESLNATATQLSSRLTSTLTVLSETRTKVLTTAPLLLPLPTDISHHLKKNPPRPVAHTQVVNYAQNTARFSAPESFLPPSRLKREPATFDPFEEKASEGENPGLSLLNGTERAWLDPVTHAPYFPWPSDEMFARSALARSQGWIGAVVSVDEQQPQQGQAASGEGDKEAIMDSEKQGEREKQDQEPKGGLKAAGGEEEEEEEKGKAQQPVKEREQAEQEKPKVFMGLDLYDPDSEDNE